MQYFQAIFWFILSLIVSCCNDAVTKYLAITWHPWQITFFRFFFGLFSLLPVMIGYNPRVFKPYRWGLHLIRGILIFLAISFWNQGMKHAPMTTATIISFSIPLFILFFASLILRERIRWPIWMATLLGFGGILLIVEPTKAALNEGLWFFLIAAALFGLLDVLNKKYLAQETMLSMLFYSTFVAIILIVYPALQVWRTPSSYELLWALVLGIGSNLILYFLLKAFSLASTSSLAPFRYLEWFISMVIGYIFFNEVPTKSSYLGAILIICSTFFIGYYQVWCSTGKAVVKK